MNFLLSLFLVALRVKLWLSFKLVHYNCEASMKAMKAMKAMKVRKAMKVGKDRTGVERGPQVGIRPRQRIAEFASRTSGTAGPCAL